MPFISPRHLFLAEAQLGLADTYEQRNLLISVIRGLAEKNLRSICSGLMIPVILPSNRGHPVKRHTAQSEPWQDQQVRPYPSLPSLQDAALALAERVGAARLTNSSAQAAVDRAS